MARGKKRLKIMVGCNLLTSVDSLIYPNHIQMWYRFGRSYPDIEFLCCFPRRTPIDTSRNLAAKHAIINECDYLFFYDDDVIVPLDALRKLLNCKADVAAGLTYVRGYPFNPMIFDFKKVNGNWTMPFMTDFKKRAKNGIVNCHAVGFSCALIDMKSLQKLPAPYFMTGTHNTEDVYYCCKLKDYIPNSKIVVDSTIVTSHLLDKYYVDDTNVAELRKFYKPEEQDLDHSDRTFEKAQRSMRVINGTKSAA